MAAITREPLYEVVPAYRPIPYTVHTVVNSLEFSANIELEVYVNGSGTGLRRYPPTETQIQNGQTLHIYELDIQEILQDQFDNDWPLQNAPAIGGQKSDELLKEFYVKFWDLLPNSDGQLVRDESSLATSQTINVLNAYRDIDKAADVADNFMANGYPFQWLTHKPDRQIIGLEDSEVLAAITDNFMQVEVIAYDSVGSQVGRGMFNSGIVTFGERSVCQVAIGPANINALQSGDWFFGSVTIDSDVKYYTITGGVGCTNGDFQPTVAPRRYFVGDTDCRTYRFRYLNSFGQYETLDVYENALEQYQTESLSYEQSLPLVYDAADRGQGKQVVWGSRTIQLVTRDRSLEEMEWFREFAKTVSLYVESGSNLIALILSDGQFTTLDASRALHPLSFTATYATRDRSQRG